MKIVLIDDDEIALFLTKSTLLRIEGIKTVVPFTNAEKALNYLGELAKEDSSLLLLVDINMPIMDGWEFIEEFNTKKIEQKFSMVSILMLTSSIDPNDTRKSNQTKNVRGFISKPLQIHHISQYVS